MQFRTSFNQPITASTANRINNQFITNLTYRRPLPAQIQVNTSRQIAPVSSTDPPKKTMIWGEPTWFMLHTLAEKVKVDTFPEIRKGLLDIIYIICTNLPCPDCAEHAKTYLNNGRLYNIQTRDELKIFLFNFHNSINIRKGYAIFSLDQLNTKYQQAITIQIIYNFIKYFSVKNKSIRMISNDIFRTRMINNVKAWLNANLKYFNP